MIPSIGFKCESFCKTYFFVWKLSIQVELILLKHIGSHIRLQSSWSSFNSFNFGLFEGILKSKIFDERENIKTFFDMWLAKKTLERCNF